MFNFELDRAFIIQSISWSFIIVIVYKICEEFLELLTLFKIKIKKLFFLSPASILSAFGAPNLCHIIHLIYSLHEKSRHALFCISTFTLPVQGVEYECLKLINYSYFEKLGLVEKTRDKARRVASLCKCNLCYLKSDLVSVACKAAIPAMEPKNIVNLNALIYVARSFFTKQNVKKFSVSKLKNALVNIRKLALDSHKEPIN